MMKLNYKQQIWRRNYQDEKSFQSGVCKLPNENNTAVLASAKGSSS
jgi:hypothetical protein